MKRSAKSVYCLAMALMGPLKAAPSLDGMPRDVMERIYEALDQKGQNNLSEANRAICSSLMEKNLKANPTPLPQKSVQRFLQRGPSWRMDQEKIKRCIPMLYQGSLSGLEGTKSLGSHQAHDKF